VTIALQYFANLALVRITLSGYPDGLATVQRSINQLYWETVRGAVAVPVGAAAVDLDDYEFVDGVENFYRSILTSTEDNMDVFTISGTWNKPSGLVAVLAILVGSGGAGGGAATTAASQGAVGGGGGSGQLRIAVIPAASLGASETVTIGVGGTGVAGAAGNAGGVSSFGAHMVANGGGGGGASGASGGNAHGSGGLGGTGGAGTAGGLSINGNDGNNGIVSGGLMVGAGQGSPSHLGGGKRAVTSATGASGNPATAGAGGSGGFNYASQGTARSGGAGGDGRLIVIHFFDQVV
jgi:hypothetical protein